MSKPAAIQAAFADFKLVRGRKVAQLVFEVPIEQADAALAALGGLPSSIDERWCGIARLDLSKASAPASNIAIPKEKRRFAELPIATQAALLCGREAFWRFMREVMDYQSARDEASTASALRTWCGVSSRSDLANNSEAAAVFVELSLQFEAWLAEPI